jgi:Tfp pilus assembly PilM family ATPase
METIKYYYKQYPDHGPLNEILLCGGGANIKSIDQIITEATNITTREGNASINLDELDETFARNFMEIHNLKIDFIKNRKNQNISTKQDSSLSYATAIGLALRNFFID